MGKIKECPFCNSGDLRWGKGSLGMRVICLSCYAEGPPVTDPRSFSSTAETTGHRRDEAYRKWNRRAGDGWRPEYPPDNPIKFVAAIKR